MHRVYEREALCLAILVLLSGAGCRKAPDSARKEQPPAAQAPAAKSPARPTAPAPQLAWETKTALNLVTFQVPEGPGWNYGFEMSWHGSIEAPDVVFAVRSDNEVKRIIEGAAAVSKGNATIAGRPAVLHEGKEPAWGPIKIWVLTDKHPSTGVDVALLVAGHKQAAFQKELDTILASIKVEPVKDE
jgi:hypothetical protein